MVKWVMDLGELWGAWYVYMYLIGDGRCVALWCHLNAVMI